MDPRDDAARGFWTLAAANVVLALLAWGCSIGPAGLIGVGTTVLGTFPLAQFAWNLPILLWTRRRGLRARARGMMLAMGLIFLGSSSCWILVANSLTFG